MLMDWCDEQCECEMIKVLYNVMERYDDSRGLAATVFFQIFLATNMKTKSWFDDAIVTHTFHRVRGEFRLLEFHRNISRPNANEEIWSIELDMSHLCAVSSICTSYRDTVILRNCYVLHLRWANIPCYDLIKEAKRSKWNGHMKYKDRGPVVFDGLFQFILWAKQCGGVGERHRVCVWVGTSITRIGRCTWARLFGR